MHRKTFFFICRKVLMGLPTLDHRVCLRQGGKASEGKDGSCGDGGNRIRKGAMNRTDPCGDLQTAAEKQPDRGRDPGNVPDNEDQDGVKDKISADFYENLRGIHDRGVECDRGSGQPADRWGVRIHDRGVESDRGMLRLCLCGDAGRKGGPDVFSPVDQAGRDREKEQRCVDRKDKI